MSKGDSNMDNALDSATANRLLETCPPGSLPAAVKKELLYSGTGSPPPPYPPGSRLRFHFQTVKTGFDKILDDSRTFPKPMELILGKKFKVEVWELAVNTMRVKEVSKFTVPRPMCVLYPMVAKVLRDSYSKKGCDHPPRTSSCCGSMLNGTGHSDLDELLKSPESLTFTFELLEVELPGDYEMESWYMTDEQKSGSITGLQEEGNKLFGQKQYLEAAQKYFEAISRLEQLLSKEIPGSPELQEIQMKKVPLLLNYSFCKQKMEEYFEAIIHINSVLELDENNVKAIFRRGQCHKQTGSFDQAREDFQKALELDGSLGKLVKIEMEEISVLQKDTEQAAKKAYQKLFT